MTQNTIDSQDSFKNIFDSVTEEVIKAVAEKTKKLLQEHINVDTYGIAADTTGSPQINQYYLDGTGIPSYEFRDKAWDTAIEKDLFRLFYDGDLMSAPSAEHPTLHGTFGKVDNREVLADLLNVSGISGQKMRSPFWNNFENEFKQKLGGWAYEEYKQRGFEISSLKGAKFE